ncbi:hypothetical protein [Tahibacter aquaticus]|uniref:hypothetical protein n=1 Tax=Tahibacter aquaticus TaxID=520092 RepID=UPI001414D0D6|nr:hypothetical protein [Tahibacter aquaticus]
MFSLASRIAIAAAANPERIRLRRVGHSALQHERLNGAVHDCAKPPFRGAGRREKATARSQAAAAPRLAAAIRSTRQALFATAQATNLPGPAAQQHAGAAGRKIRAHRRRCRPPAIHSRAR